MFVRNLNTLANALAREAQSERQRQQQIAQAKRNDYRRPPARRR